MSKEKRSLMKDIRLQEAHRRRYPYKEYKKDIKPEEYKIWKEAIEEYQQKNNLLFLSHYDYFKILNQLNWIKNVNEDTEEHS